MVQRRGFPPPSGRARLAEIAGAWPEMTPPPAPLRQGIEHGTGGRRVECGHGGGRQQERTGNKGFEHRNVLP
jgi:hypothetical protein